MKTVNRNIASIILVALTISTTFAQTTPQIVGKSLILLRYPIQRSQMGSNNSGYIPYYDLLALKPSKAPRVVNSISRWQKSVDENALLIGYIKIDVEGEYAFRTKSSYDRNELIINNEIVCKFCDGENASQLVKLPKGILQGLCT